MKLILFFLLWTWAFWKRADVVRTKQTIFFMACFLLLPFLIRLLFLVCYGNAFAELNAMSLVQGFWIGLRFDLSMLALLGGLCLVLINLPIANLKYRRCVAALSVSVLGFYALVLVADLVYFRYVWRHVGADIFNFFLSVRLVIEVALKSYGWICAVVGVLFAGAIYLSQRYISREKTLCRGPWFYEVFFLLLLGFFLWFSERGYFFTYGNSFPYGILTPQHAFVNKVSQGHLALNGAFNISYQLMPKHYVRNMDTLWRGHPTLNEMSETESMDLAKQLLASSGEDWKEECCPLQRQRKQFSLQKRKKNLIILALESLDFDSVDAASGSNLGATPNLDALMRQGQIFDKFFACTKSSSLKGIGPTMSGLCHIGGAPYFGRGGLEQNIQNGLGSIFAKAGYKTVFVRACEDASMYIGPLARLMGFETYGLERMKKEKGKKVVYDAEALEVLAEEFKNSAKPFAGFFFSTATHEPLGSWMPKKVDARIEQQFQKEPYLRSLAYTDNAIGKFIQFLKENGLYEDTVFVILGDHQLRTKSKPTTWDTYHVPFALVAPGVLAPKRVHTVAGQADILPTLVDLFHIQGPYSAMGKSLLDDTAKDWTFVTLLSGDDFGFITAQEFVPSDKPQAVLHRPMVALNKAVYTVLKNNVWAKSDDIRHSK